MSIPVAAVLCENWLVYSYWNDKSRRTEVGVIELFEGMTQRNNTAFSSLNPPASPLVMRQSFIWPHARGVRAFGVSQTERGITGRDVIVATTNGGITVVPKALIDPRRPSLMNRGAAAQEGLRPYTPELEIFHQQSVTYNMSVARVDKIYTCATGLESTSLMLATGLDLFYTRITPSAAFDVLKDDFDYFFISLVLGAMTLATLISQRLAAKRSLEMAWR